MAFFPTLWQDLRYGLRVLLRSPGVTAVSLLSLALGIGATTAIFSVVYCVLISPYPYAKPSEIWSSAIQNAKNPQDERWDYHLNEVREMEKLPAIASLMATAPGTQLLTGSRAPELFYAIMVTANAFQFLGVPPVIGRTILPSDVNAGGQPDPVIVLSDGAWNRLFNRSPSALGQKLVLNDVSYTVIGVMPSRFGWFTDSGGWIPLPPDSRMTQGLLPIMRLKPGVSSQAAQQQLQALNLQLARQAPANFPKEGFRTVVRNYMDITVASGDMESSLHLLFGAVGFLLLIACANVANLQMARGTARAREIALRMSVGAGRGRVLRQLLTESVVLSFAGGILGVLLAIAIVKATVALMPDFNVPNEARITVNNLALLFTLAVSLLTGILFGLLPALHCSRPDLVETLKDAARGSSSHSAGGRTRSLLVVAEMALCVILLVSASLTVRGFLKLQQTDLGFQSDRILMMGLQSSRTRYATYEARIAFTQKILDHVSRIPGAQAVTIANGGLPFGGPQSRFSIAGQESADGHNIMVNLVSPAYPHTLGIPLLSGRALTEQDVESAEPVALVNAAAAKLWPAGESPIGRQIAIPLLAKPQGNLLMPAKGGTPAITVVGILANTKNVDMRSPTAPAVFVPYTLVAPPGRMIAIRTEGSPMALLNSVREAVREVDKDQPLGRPTTLRDVLGYETVQPRFNMALFGFFGTMGLVLATVGIFSVLSYTVARRTHEIGIRLALGAERRDVLALVLAMGGRLVLLGLVVGLAASLALAKLLRSQVFDVPVTDPLAIAAVIALLAIAAFVACLLPARRAARLEPMTALRHE